jgi:hypothetical protein
MKPVITLVGNKQQKETNKGRLKFGYETSGSTNSKEFELSIGLGSKAEAVSALFN